MEVTDLLCNFSGQFQAVLTRRVVVGTEELMLEKKKIRRPNSMDSEVK